MDLMLSSNLQVFNQHQICHADISRTHRPTLNNSYWVIHVQMQLPLFINQTDLLWIEVIQTCVFVCYE